MTWLWSGSNSKIGSLSPTSKTHKSRNVRKVPR